MKRFWRYWLSVVATASIAASANAQQDCLPGDIGSYQSIMTRAGINQGGNHGQAPVYGQVINQPGAMVDGQVNGIAGQTQGRAIDGGVVNGGAVHGGTVNGGVMQGRAVNGYAVDAGTVHGGTVQGGAVYGSASTVGSSTGFFDGGAAPATQSANWVAGARALFFTRNGESAVPLSRNGAGDVLLSTDNDYGTMPGAEAVLTRRNCNNMGMELRYWGLFPNQRDVTFVGPGLDSYLIGLNDFLIAPGPTNVLTYFNTADDLRIYRNNEVHNMEINGLRNGGCFTTLRGRSGTYEMLGGFRWFQFNEDYRFAAFNGAVTPTQINYDLSTRNTLLGFQIGGRTESCLTDRLSLTGGTRVGLFNNRSTARQSIYNETGDFAYLTGDPTAIYDYEAQRNSLAMLGELDMGFAYRFTQKMRANIGYRLVGVNGVALAPNQIPRNFTNPGEINRVKSNDSLILGGGYAGLEMCF